MHARTGVGGVEARERKCFRRNQICEMFVSVIQAVIPSTAESIHFAKSKISSYFLGVGGREKLKQ